MPRGPLGFPRLTDIGPFVESEGMKLEDDLVLEAVRGFSDYFTIETERGESEYWEQWEGKYNSKDGVTGIWIPEQDRMLVSRRSLAHHDNHFNALVSRDLLSGTLIPWALTNMGGSWYLDAPSSAGGLYQAQARYTGDAEFTAARSPSETSQEIIWPIVYTSYMLDVPYETMVDFSFTPRSFLNLNTDEYTAVQDEVFQIGSAYRELGFELGSLPEPKVNRGQYQ